MKLRGAVIDERRVTTIKDHSGEMLRCEFSVYEPRRELKVQRDHEISLRAVTFNNGGGVEVTSDHAHAQFIAIVRDDPEFNEHMSWPDLEEKCAEYYMIGASSLLEN